MLVLAVTHCVVQDVDQGQHYACLLASAYWSCHADVIHFGQIPGALGLCLRSLKKNLWNKHDHCFPFKFGFMCSSDPSVFLGVVNTHPQTLHTCSVRLQVQMSHTRGQNWKPDFHSDHALELSLCIIWRFSHDVGLKRKLLQHFMLISTCMKHFNLHNILITQCHGASLSLSLPRLPSPLSRPAPASSFTFCTVRVSFPLISLLAFFCVHLCRNEKK